jgi:hypothetical protein
MPQPDQPTPLTRRDALHVQLGATATLVVLLQAQLVILRRWRRVAGDLGGALRSVRDD